MLILSILILFVSYFLFFLSYFWLFFLEVNKLGRFGLPLKIINKGSILYSCPYKGQRSRHRISSELIPYGSGDLPWPACCVLSCRAHGNPLPFCPPSCAGRHVTWAVCTAQCFPCACPPRMSWHVGPSDQWPAGYPPERIRRSSHEVWKKWSHNPGQLTL